ncbi:hypothetical protein Bpfe_016791 [Biomphalaria pfeifferi]|uniref:Uncharacterized protein n=1 Tax=Biomphalaria pfeifferi TaxID=112525 RepID=A0AAD8BGE2_BIOPF|nr:hypothetical protein Bpfe_016791 [Biomphalaria pfeifferi]
MGRPSRGSAEAACRTNCSENNYRDRHYLCTCQKASVSNNGHEELNETISTSSHERAGEKESGTCKEQFRWIRGAPRRLWLPQTDLHLH